MTQDELRKILDLLENSKPGGLGELSIATLTEIKPQALRKYLKKYPDYFVQLPKSKAYVLNRFGKFKGSAENMLQHYKQQQENHVRALISYSILFAMISIATLISIFN